MDRREHLKLLLAGSLGTGLILASGCSDADREISERIISDYKHGRTPEENALIEELKGKSFFTEEERKQIEVLCDIIIPADESSGSAVDAGVPDFIEFMMKDIPSLQVPVRGGLMWLNIQCVNHFGKSFVNCTSTEQLTIIDEIAYPDKANPEMEFGVRFFNRMRDLTATGYFTSETGLNYLGYVGNTPNVWDGVPENVLQKHGLSYDQKTLDECVKPEDRHRKVEWDEYGNVIS